MFSSNTSIIERDGFAAAWSLAKTHFLSILNPALKNGLQGPSTRPAVRQLFVHSVGSAKGPPADAVE
jgi:hypothetical protein